MSCRCVALTLYSGFEEEGMPGVEGSIQERWTHVAPDETTMTFRGLEGAPDKLKVIIY